jgi:predicted RNA-binding protein
LKEYSPKKRYKLALFLPCAYGKPYSQSYIHYKLLGSLKKLGRKYGDIHQIIVTNAGIVPRELEEYYPFCCYDWDPTFENSWIKARYTQVLAERLKKYIQAFKNYYENFACYLRWNSDSYKSVKMVEHELHLKIPNLSLPTRKVSRSQIEKVSLGIYTDEDLILITPTNLANLVKKLRRLME